MSDFETLVRFDALEETFGALNAGVQAAESATAQAQDKIEQIETVIADAQQVLQGVTGQQVSTQDGTVTVTGIQIGSGGTLRLRSVALVDEDVPVTAFEFMGVTT